MADAEATTTDAINPPVSKDRNAEGKEDLKNVLADLNANEDNNHITSKPENNAPADGDSKDVEKTEEKPVEANGKTEEAHNDDREERNDRHRDHEARDRGGRGRGRGRGRGNFNNRGGGVRSELISSEKSSNHDAIRKQVEFYFSDSNLPQDQFLLDKVGGNKNNPVELDVICSFKRMRHFEPREAIVEALKTSKTLRLVDDDTKVQRKNPLSKDNDDGVNENYLRSYEDKATKRSVYVKGFGEEKPNSQFAIEQWFQDFGPTNAVRLRRTDDKTFKGSAFCEFESEELKEKFLAQDPKPKFEDREMKIMSKKEYCDQKVQDIKDGKIKPNARRYSNERGSRPSFRGRGGRGGRDSKNHRGRDRDDDRDWRVRRDEDQKNGFKDDRRRDDRRGGRERRLSIEKDERGVPMIKSFENNREQEKADALAKARAAVEEGEKQENSGKSEEASLKRERDEDTAAAEEPATKKVDVKSEA